MRLPPTPSLFPYTTLFRSTATPASPGGATAAQAAPAPPAAPTATNESGANGAATTALTTPATTTNTPPADESAVVARSEEHTSELQSPCKLVCRLLLEKNN